MPYPCSCKVCVPTRPIFFEPKRNPGRKPRFWRMRADTLDQNSRICHDARDGLSTLDRAKLLHSVGRSRCTGRRHVVRRAWQLGLTTIPCMLLSACAGGSALQPDRSIFNLDNNYQRFAYIMPIEETFDRTVTVFKEAGYKLDVIDRATGQISGRRGATGDKGSFTDKDLKFYALVIPKDVGSELGIKIVQVIKSGALNTSKAELIVSDPQMYQYTFKRIESNATKSSNSTRDITKPSSNNEPLPYSY